MNQIDPEQSQIITQQNEEITTLNDRKLYLEYTTFPMCRRPMTRNYNNTASDSDWRFMQCYFHPPTKETTVPMGTGTGTTIFYSYFIQCKLFFMAFVSNLFLYAAPRLWFIYLFLQRHSLDNG